MAWWRLRRRPRCDRGVTVEVPPGIAMGRARERTTVTRLSLLLGKTDVLVLKAKLGTYLKTNSLQIAIVKCRSQTRILQEGVSVSYLSELAFKYKARTFF